MVKRSRSEDTEDKTIYVKSKEDKGKIVKGYVFIEDTYYNFDIDCI